MIISTFDNFITEKFFSKIKKRKNANSSPVDSCVRNILIFLSDNRINNWDEFLSMSLFKRDVVNKLIDSQVSTMKELEQVKFKLKLELMNRKQLLELRDELVSIEEYEKCAEIVKKLSQK